MHFYHDCDVDCSNYAQSELTHLAIDAFDRESVLGAKPKIWVQVTRTPMAKNYWLKLGKKMEQQGDRNLNLLTPTATERW